MKSYNEILQYIRRMNIFTRDAYIEAMVRLTSFIYDKTMEQIFEDMDEVELI